MAGTAAGCSSDATRFDSFYHSADNMSTGSIQGSGGNGRVPTPSADVASAGNLPPRSDLSDPMSQPLPPAQNAQYGSPLPVSSNARVVSSSPVQSAALGAPLPPAAPAASAPVRQAANTTVPAKSSSNIRMIKGPDPISTGTTPASQPAAPSKQVAAIEPQSAGQAKVAQAPTKIPVPTKGPHQEAVLPSAPQAEKKKVATAEAKDGAKGATHKVASGESLIAIAKKNGVTVEALRAANGLTSNAVRAGQELKIPASAQKVAEKPATEKVTADDMTTASVSQKPDAPLKPKATQPAAAAAAAPAESKDSVSSATGNQVASTAPAETGIGKYRWPATGAVIAAYGANVEGQRNDGIDISVPEGTPVKAAENGVVIYAGNGLEKLGNTVLIRHSDGKVTVYAHLKSIDVNRGDKVNRGQVVADSGMSGNASRPKLHFEVRKNSAPINPMSFLE
ncbi:peptidoglycan DD-metalloendopeptidase family protein [Rhizobium sp. C4]|uniref:peptidoglycan DD-metalloendopeptidase family protein n=1 Tax=Rhizobium sp. C4 TaxID=1349800 RepID=UPI001E41CF98|nr:peptidoglycan DD-metalloendopeptidase family protein [Rhizobium sp. C4]MCD2171550.1 peptidoglycan DD-metalloendopeptidase family protein [Rhizobium sp. C4]